MIQLTHRIVTAAAFACLTVGAIVGCDNRTPAEKNMDKAGDRVEKAADKVGDATKDAANKVGDKASDAGDKIKDSTK